MMKALSAGIVAFGVTSVVGGALVAIWLTGGGDYDVARREHTHVDIPPRPPYPPGKLETFDGKRAELDGAWPGFRGPNRDNISEEMIKLAGSWPKGGPSVLWSVDVGQGHAGAAVLDGRVYLHDYDEEAKRDFIRCMSLGDGRDIWRYSYRVRLKPNHGISRAVVAVTDKYLLAISPVCHVTCLSSKTGQLLWEVNLPETYGTKVPDWYSGQCPLIDKDKAIIAVGGRPANEPDPTGKNPEGIIRYEPDGDGMNPEGKAVLMMAVDCKSGKVLWEVPNPNKWAMTHTSVAVMDLEDITPTYVYSSSGGVIGVSAEDGKVFWETTEWQTRIAGVATPLPIGGDKVFLTSGYGAGSMMIQIVNEDDTFVPKVLFRLGPKVFGSDQNTPIFYKNHIFGTRPDGQLVCLDTDGVLVWTSGAGNKFGKHGPYLIADDMIFMMSDDGELTLLRATPESYQELARAQVLPGHHSWGPMALAGGRLIVRDLRHLVCLDVSRK